MTESPKRRILRRKWIAVLAAILLVGCAIFGLNYLLVGMPVSNELASDSRNDNYTLNAHYRYYVDPTTLVLNLARVDDVAPVDLFRGIFQSAKALHDAGRDFDRVILARSHRPIFIMEGYEFASIGREFGLGQNPAYLIRTLPEKLSSPSGEPAFSSWEGGWLGVLSKQMEDANDAARQWAQSR